MTYNVFGGTLNLAQSINLFLSATFSCCSVVHSLSLVCCVSVVFGRILINLFIFMPQCSAVDLVYHLFDVYVG